VLWQQVMRLQLAGARTAASNLGVGPRRDPMHTADCPQTPPALARLPCAAADVPGPAEPSAALDRV
jgi:hypothetical protein